MANIFDYLEWRGDIPFSADPFNEVDNLILAELSYADFDKVLPSDGKAVSLKDADERYFSLHPREEIREDGNHIERAPLLMDHMLTGGRFGSLMIADYVNVINENIDCQMSALTYLLADGSIFIAFRGTDSTIVGWKEDFNMSYLPETEGQRRAVEYVNRTGRKHSGLIRVGGHSKGGNFAVYASAFCDPEIRCRILQVYTNDGPGFRHEIMAKGDYRSILPKVISIVPDTSVIGMLLTSKVRHRTVRSSENGLKQHDGLTWQVERNRFETAEPSSLGMFIKRSQQDWLGKLDDESRASFVNTLFSMFESTGVSTFGEMGMQKLKAAEAILGAARGLPKERQKEFAEVITELLLSGSSIAKDVLSDLSGDDGKNKD